MRTDRYQEHPSEGHFLGSLEGNELTALLELVIPDYNVLFSPIEMVQTYNSDSLVNPSLVSVRQSSIPPLPLTPHHNVHGFEYFAVPSKKTSSIAPPTREYFLNPEMIEPLTSLLHGDPVLSPQMRPQPNPELCTPLAVIHDDLKPIMTETTNAAKDNQSLFQHYNKLRSKCLIDGCYTKRQSQGRCIRHGGGRRCSIFDCTNGAQTKGLCKRHGGGQRCKIPSCPRSCQIEGLCRKHGGGVLCIAPGCKLMAQRHGKCANHTPKKSCQWMLESQPF